MGINPLPQDESVRGMTLELLQEVLALADNPGQLGRYLTEQMRELTGARAVVLYRYSDRPLSADASILHVCPERRREVVSSPEVLKIIESQADVTEPRVVRLLVPVPGSRPDLQSSPNSILVPLHVGENRIGCLLLLDLPERERISSVLNLCSMLSTVVGLIFRNAFQYLHQEELVEQRTVELRKSEERFRAAFEGSAVGMAITACDGRFLQVNSALCGMLGYTEAELVSLDFAAVTHPEDQTVSRQAVLSMLESQSRSTRFEKRYVTQDGRTVWADVHSVLLRDRSGRPLHFITHIQDITERKEAQRKIERARDFYLQLFEEFPTLIWRSGTDGLCNYFNRTWLGFTGRTLEQEQGEGWMDNVHPDDRASCLSIYACSFENRVPFEIEYRLRRRDGEYRTVLDIGRPFFDLNGEFAGFIGSCLDITDRKNLEKQLLQSRKMEAVGHLAGGVAHDFNNLLMVINWYSQSALDILPKDDPLRSEIEEIHKAGERAAGLTRQLLAFSRKQILRPQVIQLNEILLGLEKMLRRLINEDIELAFRLGPDSGWIQADPGQVEQVIVNLMVNARDALPQGGKIAIETSAVSWVPDSADTLGKSRPGPYALLTVSDTGCGMDEATQAHLFEPFFTTKEVGKGTGLGLSTVYGIVEQSEGFIRVDSELGRGTVFRIYFPQSEKKAEPATGAPEQTEQGSETILLVEDNEMVRSITHRILRNHGYEVHTACNGVEAFELFQSRRFPIDLVITDVVMPRMSGRELAERVRAMRPGIKILFMSGYTDDVVLKHGIYEKDLAFVQKPCSPRILLQKIRQILGPAIS